MAGEKGNGHDRATAEMVEILRRMDDRLGALERLTTISNAHLDSLHKRAIGTHQELCAFRTETRDELMTIHGEIHATNERLDATNDRLDRLTDRVDGLDKRMDKLTDRVDAMALDVRQLADQSARIARLEAAVFKPAAE
jgi:chromosome segregation ATPase